MSRPVPYPANTRAKGWRLELVYEQIEQSDTWALGAEIPMCQPALLMMWFAAWTQTPAGSLPADENLIRAKCKVPVDLWPSMKPVLMRGWWLADDGRLYHDTLVSRVMEMLKKRRSDADRQAMNRSKASVDTLQSHANVTRDIKVTPNEVGRESSTDYRLPTTEEIPKTEKTARKRRAAASQRLSVDELVAEGVERQHAADWIAARTVKSLPLTRTAWDAVKAEALKAGLQVPAAIKTAAENGWAGFKASWLNGRDVRAPPAPSATHPTPSADETAALLRKQAAPMSKEDKDAANAARRRALAAHGLAPTEEGAC